MIRKFFEPMQEGVITDEYVTRAMKDRIIEEGRISGDWKGDGTKAQKRI